ncbi:MAG TPA: hypothetical protein VFV47_13020 [Hyphomicrobiaceae bacterium]|nr:hypothetical protein [Hyphomicrobiaceae bacterium]
MARIAAGKDAAATLAASGESRAHRWTGPRKAVAATVAVLLAGAAYLIAVRGEAILADLAKLGSSVFCF